MKIAVFTDTHGNLPALQAFLKAARAEGCDMLVHLGDAVGIGPQPGECLDLLLSTPRLRFVRGNHDDWFATGGPDPRPAFLNEGEFEHVKWTQARLSAAHREKVAAWPWFIRADGRVQKLSFVHYALNATDDGLKAVVPDPRPGDLDGLFSREKAHLVFHGHTHLFSDVQAGARFVNPGSLGCFSRPEARWALLESSGGQAYRLQFHAEPYDDAPLFQAMRDNKPPAWEAIRDKFFPRP